MTRIACTDFLIIAKGIGDRLLTADVGVTSVNGTRDPVLTINLRIDAAFRRRTAIYGALTIVIAGDHPIGLAYSINARIANRAEIAITALVRIANVNAALKQIAEVIRAYVRIVTNGMLGKVNYLFASFIANIRSAFDSIINLKWVPWRASPLVR